MRFYYYIILIIFTVLSLIIISRYFFSNNEDRFNQTKEIGNIIIDSINNYYKDNGKYPEELKQLCPKYLDEIQQPLWGVKKWKYYLYDEGKNFVISVGETSIDYPILYYDSKNKYWSYDS